VFEVRTSRWGFQSVGIGRYGVLYEGALRLIDTRTGTLIAQGTCVSHPTDTHDAPDLDALFANNAQLLKAELRLVEDFCADDYRTRILGLVGR